MKAKLLITLVLAVMVMFTFAACGGSGSDTESTEQTTEAAEFNPADYIESMDIEEKEDGVTYWTVKLSKDADWSGELYSNQDDICLYAVKECISQTDKPAKNSVFGFTADEKLAFTWGVPNSIDMYTLYDEDLTPWEYDLTTDELSDLGLQ